MRLLVLDTETGGLDPTQHSILSVGAVTYPYRSGEPELSILVKENPLCVTAGALEVNKIDLVAHCKAAVTPAQSWAQLIAFIETTPGLMKVYGRVVLAGHNIPFDIGFLRRLHRLSGDERAFEDIFSHRFVDTMTIGVFAQMCGAYSGSLGLKDLLSAYGLKNEAAHTALGDARATAQLLEKFTNTTQFDVPVAA